MTFFFQTNPVGVILKMVLALLSSIFYRRPLFIPPEPCDARFFMDSRSLFYVFWTVLQKHPLTAMIELKSVRTILNIIPIGFV